MGSLWLGQALSKTLTVDELSYLKGQFALLEPNKNGTISLENIKTVGIFPILFINYNKGMMLSLTHLSLPGFDEKCNRCHEGVTHS